MFRLLLLLISLFGFFSLQAQTTCLSCKGSGTCSYKARVPVEEIRSYKYSSNYYTVNTHVVYASRYQRSTCAACNGTGAKPHVPKPAPRQVVRRTPPPPTFMQNLQSKFGKEMKDPVPMDLAGPDYYAIHYDKSKYKKNLVAIIKKTGTNSHRVIVAGEYKLIKELADEHGDFFAFKAFKGNDVYLYDENGRMFFQVYGNAFGVNRNGDMWVKVKDGPEAKGTASSAFKLINYKNGRQLSPSLTYDVLDCQCQNLWSQHQLIDVTIPHLLDSNSVAKGITNSRGEMLIPPIYSGVLSCNPNDGFIQMYDESGYIHQFDLKGQLLLTTEETEVATCEDDIRVLRSNMPMLTQLPTAKNPHPPMEIKERYRLESASHPALQGATFGDFSCFDEKGWTTVQAPYSGKSYRFHKSGVLTLPSAYFEKNGNQQWIASLPEERPKPDLASTIGESTFNIKLTSENGKQGAILSNGYKDNGKPIEFTVKPIYAQVIPIKNRLIQVQTEQGLWGAYYITGQKKSYVKPEYEQLVCVDGTAGSIMFAGLKGGSYYGIGFNYDSQKFYTTPFEKMDPKRVEILTNYLAYNEKIPGLSGRIADFLQEKNIDPAYISAYQSLGTLQAFRYKDRYMVLVQWKKYNYLHTLPPGTQAVGVPVELKKGLYLPIQGPDSRWSILYISTSVIRPAHEANFPFDAVHYKQLFGESPTTIFENSCGYFMLDSYAVGMRVDEGKAVPFLFLLEEK